MPCAAGRRLHLLVSMSWEDVVRSRLLKWCVWGPHSLHTAEVTGSIPVTPTSTDTFLGPGCDACCQQIASKPLRVVALALIALPVSRVLRTSMPASRRTPPVHWCRWDSNPAPGSFAVRGRVGGRPLTCNADLPMLTAGARRGPAVTDGVRTQHGPASLDYLLAKPDRAESSPGATMGGAGHDGRGIVRRCPLGTARDCC
jgi:hypothetical protein